MRSAIRRAIVSVEPPGGNGTIRVIARVGIGLRLSPTVQQFGGRYIVLGGKLTADVGPVPKRITIIAFDSIDKAQGWLNDPRARSARDEVNKHAKTRAYTVEGTAN